MAVAAHSLLPRVVEAMGSFAPLALADTAWDNVGVLVESPARPGTAERVMLTIDLTPAVLEESLAADVSVIVAYHPVIYSGLKALSLERPLQRTVLRAISAGVSVYCPHTSLDACEGGINDWLCDVLGGGARVPIEPKSTTPRRLSEKELAVLKTGYGRSLHLATPLSFDAALQKVKEGCGVPTVRVALPDRFKGRTEEVMVRTAAVCAGSGSGCFRKLSGPAPDLLLTGEMSHHDVLAAVNTGSIVMLCEHTNTERGFLQAKLKGVLSDALSGVEVLVAADDADPLVVY